MKASSSNLEEELSENCMMVLDIKWIGSFQVIRARLGHLGTGHLRAELPFAQSLVNG